MSENTETAPSFSNTEGFVLTSFARSAVEAAVSGNTPPGLEPGLASTMCVGVFVSLKRGNQLRACLGNLTEEEPGPLGTMIEAAASRAGVADERFPRIDKEELPFLRVEVSVMHDLKTVEVPPAKRAGEIKIGEHGLIISRGRNRGLLLPQVALENVWNATTFLDRVCLKAGLPAKAWQKPETTLKTFRGEIFESEPEGKPEFDPHTLSLADQNTLVEIVKSGFTRQRKEFSVSSALIQKQDTQLGVLLECEDGKNGLALKAGVSLIDLVKLATQSVTRENPEPAPLSRFIILSRPLNLNPMDSVKRHSGLNNGAIMAQMDKKLAFVLRSDGNSIQTSLSKIGVEYRDWGKSGAELVSFQSDELPLPTTQQGRAVVSTVSSRRVAQARPKKVAAEEIAEKPAEKKAEEAPKPAPNRQKTIRSAAVAGKFYPESRREIKSAVDEYFFKVPVDAALQNCRGIMLPHAGWKYCGDIIAETVSQAKVPERVVIIGPKHTSNGANWSINGDSVWELPHAKVPVDTEGVQFLADKVPALEIETAAHAEEHGVEVLLPFLLWANPRLKIVPIAIGSAEYDDLAPLADGLLQWRNELIERDGKPPLFVISSDMNHFAEDEENRRLDEMALDKLRNADAEGLFKTCERNEISMCGMRPAVAILNALNAEETCDVEITKYDTSAKTSGDSSRVVGYAGALLR